jgi:hypothetical protein
MFCVAVSALVFLERPAFLLDAAFSVSPKKKTIRCIKTRPLGMVTSASASAF